MNDLLQSFQQEKSPVKHFPVNVPVISNKSIKPKHCPKINNNGGFFKAKNTK